MPDHVIEDPDFHVKAPAPVEKVLNDAAKAEAKAEADANPKKEKPAAPSFVQLYRNRNLAQKRASAESGTESSGSESSGSTSSSSTDSSSD